MNIRFSDLITTFLFFYSCTTVSTTNSAILKEYFENSYITEIINNTDKAIVIRVGLIYPYVTKSISLQNGEMTEHIKKLGHMTIAPRTKAFIADLKIPSVSASWPRFSSSCDRDKVREFFSDNYISINFPLACTNDTAPMSLMGLRQKGNMLEILRGEGLKSLNFSGQDTLENVPSGCFDKIDNNMTYTIEIHQVAKNIIHNHRQMNPGLRFELAKNTLDIIVRRNTVSIEEVALKDICIRPHAYIESFATTLHNGMVASIKFTNLKTEKMLDSFYSYIQRNHFMRKFAKVTKNANGVSLSFYADITKDQLQAVIDEANRAPLDYQ